MLRQTATQRMSNRNDFNIASKFILQSRHHLSDKFASELILVGSQDIEPGYPPRVGIPVTPVSEIGATENDCNSFVFRGAEVLPNTKTVS